MQAVCSRYGLAVGAYSSWFVRILMGLCCVVAYPISLILDYLLGAEHPVSTALTNIKCPCCNCHGLAMAILLFCTELLHGCQAVSSNAMNQHAVRTASYTPPCR